MYSCQDILTIQPEANSSFIVNAALTKYAPGHFIVLIFGENWKEVCFFDPTGLPYEVFDHVREYVHKYHLKVLKERTIAVQNIFFSSFCGLYCVTKLWMENHFPNIDYYTFFKDEGAMENDVKVLALLQTLHLKLRSIGE